MSTTTTPVWRRVLAPLRPALIDKVERDHTQPDAEFRRRRVVVAVVLVAGAVLLGISLGVEPGDPAFYPLTLATAGVWVVGGVLSGPLHLGRIPFRGTLRRPVVTPVLLGLAVGIVFVAGALVVRQLPLAAGYVDDVLAHFFAGVVPLVWTVALVNGVAEEVFFRGGLFAAIGRTRPVAISTAVYALATVATANPVLVLAAVVLGWVLGLQRRASGGILGPILTHVTWSSVMLLLLPRLFENAG